MTQTFDSNKWSEEIRNITYANTYDSKIQKFLVRIAEKFLVPKDLESKYFAMRSLVEDGQDIGRAGLEAFGIFPNVKMGAIEDVPKTGPLMIVANHPYGIVDGLALASLIRNYRPDVKVLSHKDVSLLPPLRDFFIPVLFNNTEEAKRLNKKSIQFLKDHLKNGGATVVFPSGAVSTRWPIWSKSQDPPWHPAALKWAMEVDAKVVPVYIEGENSWFFHWASHFGMTTRLSTLLYENYRKLGAPVDILLGQEVDVSKWVGVKDLRPAILELRNLVYSLPKMKL